MGKWEDRYSQPTQRKRCLTYAKIDSRDIGNSYHTALHFTAFHSVPFRRRHNRPSGKAV